MEENNLNDHQLSKRMSVKSSLFAFAIYRYLHSLFYLHHKKYSIAHLNFTTFCKASNIGLFDAVIYVFKR